MDLNAKLYAFVLHLRSSCYCFGFCLGTALDSYKYDNQWNMHINLLKTPNTISMTQWCKEINTHLHDIKRIDTYQ